MVRRFGQVRPVRKALLYEEVAQEIVNHIREEGLLPGSKLPSERELAYQLGVSRNCLREALRVLEQGGVVSVRPGQGIFVTGAEFNAAFEGLIDLEPDAEVATLLELIEVRELVEVQAVRLATARASDAELHDLQKVVDATRDLVASGELAIAEDIEFHSKLVKAAHNHVLSRMYQAVADLLVEVRKAGLSFPEEAARVAQQHQAILDGLRSRDAEGAAQAVVAHLRGVRAAIHRRFGISVSDSQGGVPEPKGGGRDP